MRSDVTFASEGTTCRGWLYLPDHRAPGARAPAIVMAHGFAGVKEMRLDRFAEAFAAAGLASVVFDYRGLGTSDGEPRQDLDPYAQVRDYRNAISFARTRPEIDPGRIGVWGSSYSGGHALTVGAWDRRVRAVVAQVPLIDAWEFVTRGLGPAMRDALVAQQIEERERVYAGGAPAMVPVVGAPDAALGTPDAAAWFQKVAAEAPSFRNEVTMRSWERILEYSPLRWIDRIAPTPVAIIAAEQDALCPIALAREAFARAGEPKRLVVLPVGHFDPYEPPCFADAAGAAVEWFTAHLGR
ncbi:MAG: alpha/beta hydrolase [Deltaproteobacteria bacterium]|nr:alpha/beta hydrolase [Deltaproteobacteria bacterium]